MDETTKKTKSFVEERYKKYDENGIYCPHQSIYGFSHSRGRDYVINYVRTYHIMAALSHLNFKSLLDVGAAEGYKAYMVKKLFNAKVMCTDLSEEACKRAKEIFNLNAVPSDIHDLPFKDNEFDIVLCSETLEHIHDFKKAIKELNRVARKAIIITIPHEPEEYVNQQLANGVPSGHIHSFNTNSFNFLKAQGYKINVKKLLSPIIEILGLVNGARSFGYNKNAKYTKTIINIYNSFTPILRRILGIRTAIFLIRFDGVILRFTSTYKAIIFTIFKNDNIFKKEKAEKITAYEIVNTTVPYFYLKKK